MPPLGMNQSVEPGSKAWTLLAQIESYLVESDWHSSRTADAAGEQLHRLLNSQNATIINLQARVQHVERECARLHETLLTCGAGANRRSGDHLTLQLRNETATHKSDHDETAQLKRKISHLESEIKGINGRNSRLVSERNECKTKIATLTRSKMELAQQVKKLEAQVAVAVTTNAWRSTSDDSRRPSSIDCRSPSSQGPSPTKSPPGKKSKSGDLMLYRPPFRNNMALAQGDDSTAQSASPYVKVALKGRDMASDVERPGLAGMTRKRGFEYAWSSDQEASAASKRIHTVARRAQ